jgi:hypothetical protein
MLDALCEHLLEKPNLYQDEIAIFLWDEFEVFVNNFVRQCLGQSIYLFDYSFAVEKPKCDWVGNRKLSSKVSDLSCQRCGGWPALGMRLIPESALYPHPIFVLTLPS